ncbi:MAG: AraC family transcriptional regulator [Chloroflexota bacterium]
MKPTHWNRIKEIRTYIWNHSDEPLDREQIARVSGYSVVHLHRIFTAWTGESVSAYIRRVRMQKAAKKLMLGESDVTTIALDSGYETHAAFSKVFKAHFGVTPSAFKGIHRDGAGHLMSRRTMLKVENRQMDPQEIISFSDQKVLYARATEVMTGPAFKTANIEASNRMVRYLERHGLFPCVKHMIAIYPDDAGPGKEVRFDFGTIFEDGVEPELKDGDGLAYQTIPGGKWAKFEHVGSYDTLWHTWMEIYRDWLPNSNHELRNALPFEDYIDNPSKVPVEKLRTIIYIPIC